MSRRAAISILAGTGAVALAAVVAVLASGDGDGSAADPGRNDALNPHPIAGDFEPDDRGLASCSDRACWEQAFGNLAFRSGPKQALRVFDRRIASDPAVEAACHRIAHTIGSAALARYRGDVGKAFAEGSASCWSGYYHGILERALAGVGADDQLAAAARDLCSGQTVRTTTYLAYQCVHGLGHGLMIHTGLDLPRSLRVCEQLATGWDQTSCDGGVFMENFNTSYGVRSRFIRDDDPVYPCNAVATRHKLYCYLQITDRFLETSNYDWAETAGRCAAVEADWRATCFQSYGRSASGYSRGDTATLLSLCEVPDVPWRSDCVYGAIRDIVSQDAGASRGGRFCELVAAPLRGRCFNGAGTILFDLARSGEAHRAACAAITTRYLSACLLQTAG